MKTTNACAFILFLAVLPSCNNEPGSNLDSGLADAGPAIDFQPVFEQDQFLTVTRRLGWYATLSDDLVWVDIDIEWMNTNADPVLSSFPVGVRLPFEPAPDFLSSAAGSVNVRRSLLLSFVRISPDTGTVPAPPYVSVGLDAASGALVVVGREMTVDDNPVVLTYGTMQQRLVASLIYRSTGESQLD